MAKLVVNEVQLNDKRNVYLIFTPLEDVKWKDKDVHPHNDMMNTGFTVFIIDSMTCYEGTLSRGNLEEQSRSFTGGDEDLFFSLSKDALLNECNKDRRNMFEYQIKSSSSKKIFVWKLYKETEGLKIILGSISLSEKRVVDCIPTLLQHVNASSKYYEHSINSITAINNRLAAERENALNKLSKEIDIKTRVENELFSKFTKILNSKKRRVRELERELSNCKEECDEDDVNNVNVCATSKRHLIVSSDEEEAASDDNNKESPVIQVVKRTRNAETGGNQNYKLLHRDANKLNKYSDIVVRKPNKSVPVDATVILDDNNSKTVDATGLLERM